MSTIANQASPSSLEARALPAPIRWALAFPRSPLWLAAGVGLLYFGSALATVRVDGQSLPVWDHAAYALYFGWVPLALVVLARGTDGWAARWSSG